MRSAFVGIVCLVGAIWVAPVQAVTLQEALAQAYLNNPTLQAARAQLRQTDELVPEALAGWRPTIIGNIQGGYQSLRQNPPLSSFGGQDNPNSTPRTYGVTVTQPLFRGFRTVAGTEAAEKRVLAGRQQLSVVEQNILLQAVTAYMNVFRDQAILDVNRKNVEVLQRQVEAAKARFEAGQTTRTDIAQAESRLALGIGQRIQAEGNVIASRAVYQQIIGQAPDQVILPSTEISIPPTMDAAVQQSAARPELQAAKHEADAAREDIRVAFGELLPEISIEGSFTRAEDTRPSTNSEDTGTVLGTLRIPLYQAGAPDARVRRAKERYSELLERINEQYRAAVQQAVDSWRQLQTAQGQIVSAREQAQAAQIALQGVIEEQQVGARTVLDIFDAEQEVRDAEVAVIQAQTAEVVARHSLIASIGKLTAKTLALNVPLYDETKHYEDVHDKFIGWDTGE